jgi:hypothetical protein
MTLLETPWIRHRPTEIVRQARSRSMLLPSRLMENVLAVQVVLKIQRRAELVLFKRSLLRIRNNRSQLVRADMVL